MNRALLRYRLELEGKVSNGCGGVLITKNYVLTAAHCITRDLFQVRLGDHDLRTDKDCEDESCLDPVQDIDIEKKIKHPNYNPGKKTNDIALLKLKTPADITKNNVKLVCLPAEEQNQIQRISNDARKKMTIAGWGITETGQPSDVLLKANIPYLTEADCKSKFGGILTYHESYLCAGGTKNAKNQKIDACQGIALFNLIII